MKPSTGTLPSGDVRALPRAILADVSTVSLVPARSSSQDTPQAVLPRPPVSFVTKVADGVTVFGRADWDALFGNSVLGWNFCRAAELAPPPGFHLSAIGVLHEGNLVAAAPVFQMTYRVSTSLPAPLRRIGNSIARIMPRLVDVPVLGLGSPYLDRCPIGFAPHLDLHSRLLAWEALLRGFDELAIDTRSHFVAIKDLSEADRQWAEPPLVARRFARMASLPVAVLDVPFTSEREYLASLPSSMRQDLNRKLRQSRGHVRFEVRRSIGNLEPEIYDLYHATRSHRRADYGGFDTDSPAFITSVLEQLGDRAQLTLGRVGDQLASFSLSLFNPDCAYAYRIGMRYPLARDHNLYFLNWLMMVRMCIERGASKLEMGQTCYVQKQRLGCRLEQSWVYVRHQARPVNWIVQKLAPRAGFDRMEAGAGGH